MTKRPKSKIQRGFVLGYLAIAVMVIATGFALKSINLISADTATVTPVTPTGTSCLTGSSARGATTDLAGSSVAASTVTDTEKTTFGNHAVAYTVTTAQSKKFKLILGVKEVSHSGSGGNVSFTYGFQNLGTASYGNDKDGALLLYKLAPGEQVATGIGSSPYPWGVTAATHFLVFDQRNNAVAPQAYWSATKSLTVADYTSDIRISMFNGGSDGLAHQQVCIDKSINLKEALAVAPSPTPVASPSPVSSVTTTASVTASVVASATATTNSVTLKHGFNTIVVPNDGATVENADSLAIDTTPITDKGMFVYDFNRLGQKNWRTTNPLAGVLFGNIERMVTNIGYYVYNPGSDQTVNLPVISTSQTISNEEKIKIRRGWNLVGSTSTEDRNLSDNYIINVLNQDAANDCIADSCYSSVSIRSLFAGNASTSRAYGTIYEIKDGTATTADAAFTTVKIDSTNIDTITIPKQTPFWIYLWN